MKALECSPNKLTPLYSKIHYEEENYLKVKIKLFIYPSPPHSKGLGPWERWYVGILRPYVLAYSCTELHHVTRLPLIPWFYWFDQSHVPRTDSYPIQVLS